ncbi:MAG: hypothetical protein HYT81_14355 [Gemmatimonadetes bacterium]|nr:hypothetical protein [Gemmatimonadota bacterium]
MRALFRVGLVLAVIIPWAVGPVGAQDSLTRKNSQGPVTVTLTLVPPIESGASMRVQVVLDTHSGPLDGLALESVLALRRPDGSELRPSVVEQSGGGDHRQAVVVFPGAAVEKAIEIVVRNVGGVQERSFHWELPVGR